MWRRYERLIEDQRRFTQECLMRFDRVVEANTAALRDLRASSETMRAELRDLRAAGNAQTQALMAVLDRLDRIDPGGAAA